MGNPLTEQIARIIEQMIDENGGQLELQRNKLAGDVGCVPSQINYVITSRFNTGRGYIVESRRGGGGFVKITKVNFDSKNSFLMHLLCAVGDEIDEMSARGLSLSLYDNALISQRELGLLQTLLCERALQKAGDAQRRAAVRADLLKSFILALKN